MPNPEGRQEEQDQQPPCHACGQTAVGRCKRCDQAYCNLHGGVYCVPCGRLIQEADKKGSASELARCIAWGALLAFPTLIVGFCTGFYWDGESSEGVNLGVLLWPIWAAYTLCPVRGLGWVYVGPLLQWAGYALLVYAGRLTYRGSRVAAGKESATRSATATAGGEEGRTRRCT
jgi:hypothetical protein